MLSSGALFQKAIEHPTVVVRAGVAGSRRPRSVRTNVVTDPISDEQTALAISGAVVKSIATSSVHFTEKPRRRKTVAVTPLGDFFTKVKMAWNIFFPANTSEKYVSPKELGKRRLKMILVADRCGMNAANLSEIRKTIVKALQEFVVIDSEGGIEVSVSTQPEVGTVYCVAVPVRRVRPEVRFGQELAGADSDGVSLEWDPEDWESDPAARFPMGT